MLVGNFLFNRNNDDIPDGCEAAARATEHTYALDLSGAGIICDGQCGFCRVFVDLWKEFSDDRIIYRSYQDVHHDFPQIKVEAFAKAVHYIDAQGSPFVTPFRLWESYEVTNNPDKIVFIAQQDYLSGDVLDIQSKTANRPAHRG